MFFLWRERRISRFLLLELCFLPSSSSPFYRIHEWNGVLPSEKGSQLPADSCNFPFLILPLHCLRCVLFIGVTQVLWPKVTMQTTDSNNNNHPKKNNCSVLSLCGDTLFSAACRVLTFFTRETSCCWLECLLELKRKVLTSFSPTFTLVCRCYCSSYEFVDTQGYRVLCSG